MDWNIVKWYIGTKKSSLEIVLILSNKYFKCFLYIFVKLNYKLFSKNKSTYT